MNEELFMQRALELAQLAQGDVSPNPMVGCVIVHNGKIIGEGWHQHYGEPHAEVNAVANVLDKAQLPESTVYVTLEPCSHFGKTPPCADLLIKHQVKKVVVCNKDPFPLVAGQGIEKLRQAGIEVSVGLLEQKGAELNKRFFTAVEQKRPYIILKWAETADGYIAGDNYQAVKISNQLSHKFSHKWRSEEDAIMVGTNTAIYDNPQLNVRMWTGRNPIRVIIDKQLRIPMMHHLLDNKQKTIIYNDKIEKIEKLTTYVKVPDGADYTTFIITDLLRHSIQSVLVEGGAVLLQSLLGKGLYDEVRVFKSKKCLTAGIKAPFLPNLCYLSERIELLDDEVSFYRKTKNKEL